MVRFTVPVLESRGDDNGNAYASLCSEVWKIFLSGIFFRVCVKDIDSIS